MEKHDLEDLLTHSSFFNRLRKQDITLIAGCGQTCVFQKGELMAHEGDPADVFYMIRKGKASIESHVPGRGAANLQTVGSGEVLGWSWLYPPYAWMFDVRALELTKAISFDAKCLRGKFEHNHSLGFRMMQAFTSLLVSRLRACRLQALDIYQMPQRNQS